MKSGTLPTMLMKAIQVLASGEGKHAMKPIYPATIGLTLKRVLKSSKGESGQNGNGT